MNKSSRPDMKMIAVVAWTVLAAVFATPALAQLQVPSPPPFQAMDRNGVDLVSGTITYQVGSVSIGGLTDSVSLTLGRGPAQGYRHSLVSGINEYHEVHPFVIRRLTVTLMGDVFVFTRQIDNSFVLREGRGGKLEITGGNYVFTATDGSVATFSNSVNSWADANYIASLAGLTTIVRPNGERITYHYTGTTDLNRKLQSVTNNLGYQIHFEHDANAVVTKVTAINNAVDPCSPTASTCTLTQTWPSLDFTGVGWPVDATGRQVVTAPDGRVWPSAGTGGPTVTMQLLWDTTEAVATVSDGAGTWTYTYGQPWDPNPDEVTTNTITDPLGHVTEITVQWYEDRWHDAPKKEARLKSVENAEGGVTSYGFDGRGNFTSITRPEGDRESWTYLAHTGAVGSWTHTPKPGSGLSPVSVTATYPAGCTAASLLCARPLTVTDARGNTTTYIYNAVHGGLETVTGPPPSTGAVAPQTRYAYAQARAWYKHNGSASITQETTQVWLPVETAACVTLATNLCDGTAGEVVTTTAYQAGSSSAASNLLPISVSTGAGDGSLTATTTTSYTAASDPEYVNGPLAGTADTSRTIYDAMRRPIGAIGPDPDGAGPRLFPASRTTLNADAQPVMVEQGTTTSQTAPSPWTSFAALQTTTTAYNTRGFRERDVAAPGTAAATLVQYEYDAAAQLSCTAQRMDPADFAGALPSACTQTTPVGPFGFDRILRTNYDNAGRVTSTVSGWGTAATITESQTLTANSKVATRTDGNGNVSTYAYDGLDRITSLRFPNASGGGSSPTDYEAYAYDANSNPVTKRTRGGDTFTTTFDTLNRITRVVADTTGARAVPDTRFTYDNLDRRLTACFWVSSACTQTVTAAWDVLGRQTSETGQIGTVGYGYDLAGRRTSVTWPDAVAVNYTWDLSDEVTTITQGASSLLATYSYNNLAQRTGVARPANTVQTSNGYDAAFRVNALSQNLGGAATSNDQSLTFTRNPASQLATRTATNTLYNYAPTVGATGYVNNGRNQVTSAGGATITYDVNFNITNDGTTAYAYDAANRLKSAGSITYAYDPLDRLYQENATAGRRFLYAGDQLIGEYNTSNVLQSRYVPGPGTDEPLAEYAGSAVTTPIFHVQDERGSIVARVNASALVGALNKYDDYGVPVATNTGRFQYTGQTRLADTQLYYYKARVYAPALGRFLQADPIGYEAGLNLYAYVRNDPINAADPTGLCEDVKNDAGDITGQIGLCGIGSDAAKELVDLMLGDANSSASRINATAIKEGRRIELEFLDGDPTFDGGRFQDMVDNATGESFSLISIDREDLGLAGSGDTRMGFRGQRGRRPVTDYAMPANEAAEHELSHEDDRRAGLFPLSRGEDRAVRRENDYRRRSGNNFRRGSYSDWDWVPR